MSTKPSTGMDVQISVMKKTTSSGSDVKKGPDQIVVEGKDATMTLRYFQRLWKFFRGRNKNNIISSRLGSSRLGFHLRCCSLWAPPDAGIPYARRA